MKIYFYQWYLFATHIDSEGVDELSNDRIETFSSSKAALNSYNKKKKRFEYLDSLDQLDNKFRFHGGFIGDIMETKIVNTKDLKNLCEFLVNKGEIPSEYHDI